MRGHSRANTGNAEGQTGTRRGQLRCCSFSSSTLKSVFKSSRRKRALPPHQSAQEATGDGDGAAGGLS